MSLPAIIGIMLFDIKKFVMNLSKTELFTLSYQALRIQEVDLCIFAISIQYSNYLQVRMYLTTFVEKTVACMHMCKKWAKNWMNNCFM